MKLRVLLEDRERIDLGMDFLVAFSGSTRQCTYLVQGYNGQTVTKPHFRLAEEIHPKVPDS